MRISTRIHKLWPRARKAPGQSSQAGKIEKIPSFHLYFDYGREKNTPCKELA